MVLKGTKLYKLYKQGKYKPLTTEQATELIIKFKKIIPEYVRIMRVQRDIPTFMTEAGVNITNLRQKIQELMREKKLKCKCIRCREIGRSKKSIKKINIKIKKYVASKGTEFFISMESNNYIFGFCRLRFPSQQLRKEITESSALIRELHVFGPSVSLGKKGLVQHKGLGRKLLKTAEKIAKNNHKKKIVVISGIGARAYYKKLGYKKQGPYMVKRTKG
jgi:elongator complex protein 3